MPQRQAFDASHYMARMRSRARFICALVAGDPDFAHHVAFEDQQFGALDAERAGVLVMSEAEMLDLAARIGDAVRRRRS